MDNDSNTDVGNDNNTDQTVTENVPQTLDNIQSYVFLLLFGLCTFVISFILYSRKNSKSSM